ncbi:MAG: hypothetical protein G8345_18885, partial [Magnetococcales bacterium]|nr:hypothetical protein [Magnetococcales bacterium]
MNLETEVSVVHTTQRRRILLLVTIMIAMGVAIGGMTLTVLYQTSLEQTGNRLVDSVKGLARLIEAIARHHMPNMPDADTFSTRQLLMEDTLNQLREAKAEYPGQGE